MEVAVSESNKAKGKQLRKVIADLYGKKEEVLTYQLARYQSLRERFADKFSHSDIQYFSTPGRTEIGGNHTDHNHGCVLAAAVNLDSIAAAAKTDNQLVTVWSQGYACPFAVDLNDLNAKIEEQHTTTALIRGIAARLKELDYQSGGFNAYIMSDVLPGSGLSSSASIEVLIATIFNALYNQGKIEKQEIAKIGQYAENHFFNKPCGLMDQIACAMGGIVSIDFETPDRPKIKTVHYDFSKSNFTLMVVNTGGNHADLTDDYASIPNEMKSVAQHLQHTYCRSVSLQQVLKNTGKLRLVTGDRAILRAMHFLWENERVLAQVEALEKNNFAHFLQLINESGNSSFKWLQNCYTTKNASEQGISLALALTENYFKMINQGACRVHGGGFAGTILVLLPTEYRSGYIDLMEKVFGENSISVLDIRSYGTIHFNAWL